MKNWRTPLLVAIVLLTLLPITSETKSEPVTLSVTEIVLPTGFEELGGGSFFEFHATLNVFNPNSEDFTISHPDTCGFMILNLTKIKFLPFRSSQPDVAIIRRVFGM